MKLKILFEAELAVPTGPSGPEDTTRIGDVEKQKEKYEKQATDTTATAAKEIDRLAKNLRVMNTQQPSGSQSRQDTGQAFKALDDLAKNLTKDGNIYEIIKTGIAASAERVSKEPESKYKTGGLGIGAAPGT